VLGPGGYLGDPTASFLQTVGSGGTVVVLNKPVMYEGWIVEGEGIGKVSWRASGAYVCVRGGPRGVTDPEG
jgi:hypothetical protein